MKRFLTFFLLSFALLTFCSCSDQSAVREPQNDSSETTDSDSVSDRTETDDKNEPMIFTKDFDGLVLTVTTDKSAYSAGDEINVTAALENRSDKDVNLYYGMYPEPDNLPVELRVTVEKLLELPPRFRGGRSRISNIYCPR